MEYVTFVLVCSSSVIVRDKDTKQHRNRRQALAMIIQNATIIFFEDEDRDSKILEKIENYAEYTVPKMNKLQFRHHFRMDADTFENLLRRIFSTQQDNPLHLSNFPTTVLEKEVMVSSEMVANKSSLFK